MSDDHKHLPPAYAPQRARDRTRRIGDVWQWLGISGDAIGTGGVLRRTFLYAAAVTAAVSGVIIAQNIITTTHAEPHLGLWPPMIWEGSSWITLMAFFWIPWVAYRLAPPRIHPHAWLLLHLPALALFALGHIGGFIVLRALAYRVAGSFYDFGPFATQFLYEFRKDLLTYPLIIGGFWLIERLLRQQQLIATPGQSLTFDIRDGAKLTRVRLSQILAITAAGNYIEFALEDGRKLLMRSSLGEVESDLGPRGFVRTHRSWLVNEARVTELSPDGSGDYTVTLDALKAPLSRRFPAALARLRR